MNHQLINHLTTKFPYRNWRDAVIAWEGGKKIPMAMKIAIEREHKNLNS